MEAEQARKAVCEVCNSHPALPVLACSQCSLQVHPRCFGEEDEDDSKADFVCTECQCKTENLLFWGETDLDDDTVCSLCPISARGKRGLKVLMRNKRRLGYAHVLCGMFLPGASITIRHVDLSQVKQELGERDKGEGEDETCVMCHTRSMYPATKCSFPECTLFAHPTCASLAMDLGFELSTQAATLACPCHSTMAVKCPQKAEDFLKRLAADKANNAADKAASAAAAAATTTTATTTMVVETTASTAATAAAGMGKKKTISKRKMDEPKLCDPNWLHRRVSMFLDETVGTIVEVLASTNQYVVALDDGATKVKRTPDEVNLIPVRAPGCFVCKKSNSVEDVLLCDLCDVEHHLSCAKPPLKQIPEGKWFCEDCTKKKKKRQDELASKARALAKLEKQQEKKLKLDSTKKKNDEENEDEEEYSETKKKKPSAAKQRSSLRLKTKGDTPATSTSTTAGVGGGEIGSATTISKGGRGVAEEQDIDFDGKFPELQVEDWTLVWEELLLVQRMEVAALLDRLGAVDQNEAELVRCKPALLVSKFQNSELPLKCVEGYLGLAGKVPLFTSEEDRLRLEACVGRSLQQVEFALPTLPARLGQQHRETEGEETILPTAMVMDSAIQRCEDSLVCIDFTKLAPHAWVLEVMEKLRLDCERVFSRATLPAFRARELFRRLQPRLKQLRESEFALKTDPPPPPKRPIFHVLTEYQSVALPERDMIQTMQTLNTVKTASHLVPTSMACDCFAHKLACANRNPALELTVDLVESDTWGFDSPTRKFIDLCLESAAGLKLPKAKNQVVDGLVLKCLKSTNLGACLTQCLDVLLTSGELLPNAYSFLDMLRGLQAIRLSMEMFDISVWYRGQGILATRTITPYTFVSTYLGEVYPPWRWFERQDNVKLAQNKVGFKPPVPEVLPVVLERHEDDPKGYDVVFVDPTVMGNFASRLQHACEPNCQLEVQATIHGQFQLALFALREISMGEELTINRNKLTEEEQEYLHAVCLCSKLECRGSFLTWSGSTSSFSSSTTDVLANSHSFLDRVSLLLLSSMEMEKLNHEVALLRKFGLGESVFAQAPNWMKQWASYILRFIEFENDSTQPRRQNLAITINKIAYFLRTCGTEDHPLRCLEQGEIMDFLWNAPESVAKRAVEACRRTELPREFQAKLDGFMQMHLVCDSSQMARSWLQQLGELFWAHPHSFCENCGDVLLMYALTETWFTATQYQGFKSVPLTIRNVDIGRELVSKSLPLPQPTPVVPASVVPTTTPPVEPALPLAPTGVLECAKEQLIRIHYSISGEKQRISKDQPLMRGKTLTVFSFPLPGTVQLSVHRDPTTGHCSIVPPSSGEEEGSLLQPTEVYFTFYAFPEDNAVVGNLVKVALQSYYDKDKEYVFQSVKDVKLIKYLAPGEQPSVAAIPISTVQSAPLPPSTTTFSSNKREPIPPNLRMVFNEPKKYQAGFAWGQLVGWWKQTVSDPSASLSAERRGSLSLPDVETCFAKDNASMEKFQKSRRDMLKKIKERPDGMWPVTWPYSFRNKEKIYGSPWFDDALESARAGDFAQRTSKRATHFLQIVHEHLETANL